MASPETATPATALCGKPAPIVERFAGELDLTDSKIAERLQVTKLIRTFAISTATAAVIAELAFVAGCSR
jgi:hypothetical protein